MKFHQIDVDDEVFDYLKKMAEPFVDTPNSVLRRELLNKQKEGTHPPPMHHVANLIPSFPPGVLASLREILSVIFLVIKKRFTRPEATQKVADHNRITPQTVLDKYCRQLGLKAYEFDRLLAQEGLSDLKKLLIKKFPNHSTLIVDFYREHLG